MIWVGSIVLGIVILGMATLGMLRIRVPKSLAIPSVISSFAVSTGIYLIWLAKNNLLTQKEGYIAMGVGGGAICLGIFLLVVASVCFAAGINIVEGRGKERED